MNGLGTFLLAIAGPIAKRLLVSLGFGIVSYAAVGTALTQVLSAAKNAWGGLAAEPLAIIQIAGINTAVSIVAGALVAKVGLNSLKKLQLVA